LTASSILATGGASTNQALLQVIANVFGVPVDTAEIAASAALGAAYRALHAWQCLQRGSFVAFSEVLAAAPPFRRATVPEAAAHTVYSSMLDRFARLEGSLCE
jgi:xylulokinase